MQSFEGSQLLAAQSPFERVPVRCALTDLALTAQHDVHLDGDFVERTDGHT